MTTTKADREEHVQLSWWLIERKVAYYKPEAVHSSRAVDYEATDAEYDAAELRYLTLCRHLGHTNTIVHKGYPGFEGMTLPPNNPMMEIDITRPSVQLVLSKLGSIK